MKYTLYTHPVNAGPFNCQPARTIELDDERIATTGSSCNIRFPWEPHPYNVRLWVIGNEFGALGAVWASNEGDAIDELIDRDLGQALLVTDEVTPEEEEEYEYSRHGNASELCDLTNVWMQTVSFELPRDRDLIVKLAEARGACVNNLSLV